MNRISTFSVKKLAFSVLAMLLFSSAWAQRLSGNGSENSPYLIGSAEDWTEFTNMINGGSGNTAYYKLTADITLGSESRPITTVVGLNNSSQRFKGHFDGDWHTITIYLNRTVSDAAPFGRVESASFCNLRVAGTITTNNKFAGGIVAFSYASTDAPTTFTNCTSSINIVSNTNGDGTHAGLVGQSESGNMTFEQCLFEGSITGANTIKCAGFLGWTNGLVTYTDCLMAGTISISGTTSTFHRCRSENGTYNRAYYITSYGGHQGSLPPTDTPDNMFYKEYDNNYKVPGCVMGLEQTYYEITSGAITITPVVAYFGTKLSFGSHSDYTISLNGESISTPTITINNPNDYVICITARGDYVGSHQTTINVTQGNISDWATLKALLSVPGNKNITLVANGDFTAGDEQAIVIPARSNITLNLNSNTLDRNLSSATAEGYVIYVSENATLILSNGTVTGGNNNGNGGGIYNAGTLNMTDVTITGNRANKNNSVWGTGGGIYNAAGSNFCMENGSITNNIAYGGGGGIHATEVNNFSMDGVTVSGNSATSKGGGIRLKTGRPTCSISNCTITNNHLPNNDNQAMGGGIYLEGPSSANVSISECTISDNSAKQNGGGIYVAAGKATLTNCNIKQNSAHVSGGGIYLYAGTLYVYGTTTIGGDGSNTSTSYGGGVYVRGNNKMHIKGTPIISNNVRDNDGHTEVQNVYLESTSNVIYVDGVLSADANIGVTKSGNVEGTITHGLTESGNQNPYNFFSDYSEHNVFLQEDEAFLGIDPNPNTFRHNGGWNDKDNWSKGLPSEGDEVWIRASATIPNGYTANVGEIDAQGGEIIIEDGGQLIHSNAGVTAMVLKTVSGYGQNSKSNKTDKWYFIASPIIDDQAVDSVKELIPELGDYDLYELDESQDEYQWWNYKAETFDIQHTKGYLYAREKGADLQFSGELKPAGAGSVAVELAYTSGKPLAGWNLVGNPFPCNAYADMPYYIMNKEGNGFTPKTTNDAIPPCTGILMHTDRTGHITFSKDSGNSANRGSLEVALAKTDTREVAEQDNAVVSFNQGEELPKFVFSENNAKIYIPQGREDYAIVGSDKKGEMPVHFKAVEDGTYSITVNPKDVEMDYLHLIDNSTHADIDLLAEPSYSFSATTTDAESRFKLVFRASDNEEETNRSFAFINNGQIILFDVEKEGTLQVIDLLGHVIFSGNAEQTVSVAGMPTGVYVLRLLQGEHTLTQKIVIQN